jgi:fructose-specific phosphotransferase system component IIB
MGRTKRATSMVYRELKERAKEVGLNINVENTKAMGAKQETQGKRNIDCKGTG